MRILLFSLLAAPLFAQGLKVSDRWNLGVKGFTGEKLDVRPARPQPDQKILLRQLPFPVCSVPLINVEIPDDVDYKIHVVPVPREPIDNMPKLVMPGPPCQAAPQTSK